MFLVLFLVTLIAYLSWFYLVKTRKLKNEPPGPRPWPIIGNLHHIIQADPIIFQALHKLSMQYGSVYTLWFGRRKQVVVSGVQELKEMMHNPAFDDRTWPPKKQIVDEIYSGQTASENPYNLGVLFASGDNWKYLRRFTMKSLRDHGFGKQTAENFILNEAQYLVNYVRGLTSSNPVVTNLDEIFTMMALNVVWQMAAGQRFNYEQEGMQRLLQYQQCVNETFWSIQFSALTPMPFLKHFYPMKNVVDRARIKMASLRAFYKETIDEHRNTFDETNIRDVIDAFLLQESKSVDSVDSRFFNDNQLMVILSDLFLAGSETTGKSMEWSCLFMLLHPDVQAKVQDELDEVVGTAVEEVKACQRPLLPYTEATLHEIWRCGPVGPIAAIRCCNQDSKVGRFTLTAGTVVFPNLYSMTQDPVLWGPDVQEFNPNRFIKDNKFHNPWWDFTFGTGRRKCLGESVARIENFLFFANLLKNFKLQVPDGEPLPKKEPVDGMTIGPHHFSVKFTSRK